MVPPGREQEADQTQPTPCHKNQIRMIHEAARVTTHNCSVLLDRHEKVCEHLRLFSALFQVGTEMGVMSVFLSLEITRNQSFAGA